MTTQVQEVPIDKLTTDQLTYVGKQVEQEISNYSSYYTSLKVASYKFSDNKEYINEIMTYQDKEILVPMTSSLYIPGKQTDIKRLTLEIGGNFFVETSVDKALKFCDRKLDTIEKSMTKIDEVIKIKTNQLNAINQKIIEKSIPKEK